MFINRSQKYDNIKFTWQILICLTLFICSGTFVTLGQNYSIVGVGNGQNLPTGTVGPAPFGNASWGTRHQFFITASELNSSGIVSNATINSIGLNVITDNGAIPHNGFQLKIYTTTNTNPIGTTYLNTGLVSTSTATNYDVVLGWNQINVTAFTWNGTSNLVIETCFNNTSISTNAVTEWTNALTGTAVKSRYRFANTTGICANTTTTGTSTTTRPIFRFGWYPPAPISITSSEISICTGGSTILTANGSLGTTNWFSGGCGGTLINTGATIAVSPSAPGETYFAQNEFNGVTSLGCVSTFINVDVIPISGVASSNQTICLGTSPSDINLIGSIGSIQWQESTDNLNWTTIPSAVSSVLTSFDMGQLTNSKFYRAVVTSGACGSVFSNSVSVSVNTLSAGAIGNSQTFCYTGDPSVLTFLTSPSGSGALSYQWQSSPDNTTWSNIPSETSIFYDPPLLNNTSYYRTIVFSLLNGISCNSSTNVVTVSINNPGGGTIGSNQTICSGVNPATFTSINPASGLGALSYEWESSVDNVNWSTIVGANLSTFSSGPLSQTTYFRRKLISTFNSQSCIAYSNVITVTINLINSGSIGSNQTICSAGNPDPFTTIASATGSGALTYQWQSSTNGTSWTNINGATQPVYDVPNGLSSTTYYQLIVSSMLNNVGCISNSNSVIVTINNVTGGSITANQTVCFGGDPAAFSSTVAGTGSGVLTYQWQYSVDNINWTNVPSIPVGTGATYNPDPITVTTYYRRQRISSLNGITCSANSNTATVTVNNVSAGVIGINQTVCTGGDPNLLNFTTSPSGTGTLTYQWQSSLNGTTWTTVASTPTYNPPVGISSTTQFRVIVTSTSIVACSATSNVITITVNTLNPGTISATQTYCASGDAVPLSFTAPATSSGTLSYQWQSSSDNVNWTSISGATSTLYDPPILTSTTYFRVVVTSALNNVSCSGNTNVAIAYINTPSGGIIGSDQTICTGTSPATFTTITAANGLGTLTYTWDSSTDNINWNPISGATSATYTSGTLTQSTYFRRTVTATFNGIGCSSFSNVILVTVNQLSAPIIASNQIICSGGSPSDLTIATLPVGSGAITYQWQFSANGTTGWTSISGATGNVLTSLQMGSLTSQRYFRLVVNSVLNGVSCSVNSNNVLVSINSVSGGTIGSNQTICSGGDPVAFTSSIAGSGSGSISYQWQYSIDNINWINVSTMGINLTYNADPITSTTYYRRKTISTLNGSTCETNSNVITVTVNQIDAGIIGSNQTICGSTLPTSLTFSTLPTGTGTLSYIWQSSINGTTWTNITGGTNSTLSTAQIGSLTATKYFRVIVISTFSSTCSDTSNTVTITVNNVNSGIIGSNQTICESALPAPLNFTTLPSGTGLLSYQWQSSPDNSTWTNISGANLTTYSPPALTTITYFRVLVTSEIGPPNYVNSLSCSVPTNSISIFLNSFNPGTIGSDQTICSGGNPAILNVVTSPSGSGTFTYQWQSSANNVTWATITGATSSTYDPPIGLSSSTYYRRLTFHTNLGITCTIPTNSIYVSIYTAGTISSPQTICSGTEPGSLNISGAIGNIQWQYSTNGTTGWINIPGATGTILSSSQMGMLISNRYYRVTLTGTSCSQVPVSNTVLITIISSPVINAGADQTICQGASITLSASGGNNYQWSGGITNNVSFTPTGTSVYTVTGTGSNGCQGSDDVFVTVNPLPTVIINNNNPSVICQGQSFSLSSTVFNVSNYQWRKDGLPINGANTANFTGNQSGSYTLLVVSPQGCSTVSSPLVINITPLPTVNAGPDQQICTGESVTLTASGSTNYSWSNGIQNGVAFNPINTSTYTVSTTSVNGCVGSDQVNVIVNLPSSSTIYTTSLGSFWLNNTEYSESGVYTQTLINQYGCDSTITLTLTVLNVGISENVFNPFAIFPNPSNDGIFNIQHSFEHGTSMIILDYLGNQLMKFVDIPNTVDLSNLSKGIYFMGIYNQDKKVVVKIECL